MILRSWTARTKRSIGTTTTSLPTCPPSAQCSGGTHFTGHTDCLDTHRMSMEQVRNTKWYVGWAVCQGPVAEQLRHLYNLPQFLQPDSTPPKRPWIFIGTHSGAPYHIDGILVKDQSSWQAQIAGSKTWYLRPPPECWWSCGRVISTTIHPGDIIVVNTNVWFHSTKVEGPGLNLCMTNEYD